MSKLKFRVWDTKNKRLWYPFPIPRNVNVGELESVGFEEDGSLSLTYVSRKATCGCCPDYTETMFEYKGEIIVNLCTGLKDMNGNLIYEGDILETTKLFSFRGAVEVKFYEDFGRFRLVDTKNQEAHLFLEDMGIVGNIYENNKR